jgi:futalosine hydrolase
MKAICVVAALDDELAVIKRELGAELLHVPVRRPRCAAILHGTPLYLAAIGVGPIAAALSLGGLFTEIEVDRVIMTGSAGALPGSGMEIGDVAVAASETFAEVGVCVGEGIGDAVSIKPLGIHKTVVMDEELARSIISASNKTLSIRRGPFLTVAGVSGDLSQALSRARRFEAVVENMEGYSLALAAEMFGVKAAEVRGVSNMAGVRDKRAWNPFAANEAAQSVLLNYLRRFS